MRTIIWISIHSPRMGRDESISRSLFARKFQSTLPAWGETRLVSRVRHQIRFQSTLPAWGETSRLVLVPFALEDFNPLSPHGERLWSRPYRKLPATISIHSPRMGRDNVNASQCGGSVISIHSPRMGRDGRPKTPENMPCNFNPLSPHGERLSRSFTCPNCCPFQSTLPAWGETSVRPLAMLMMVDFNPLSPHGERPANRRIK